MIFDDLYPWRERFFFLAMLGIMAAILSPPIYRLSRAIEGFTDELRKDYIIKGTIPPKPDGKGYKLQWVQEQKSKGRR